jgi:hypothetical protein
MQKLAGVTASQPREESASCLRALRGVSFEALSRCDVRAVLGGACTIADERLPLLGTHTCARTLRTLSTTRTLGRKSFEI